MALTQWDGDEFENRHMDAVLQRLLHDDGAGGTDNVVATGRHIRTQAVIALARRGSPLLRLADLEELLKEEKPSDSTAITGADQEQQPDGALGSATVSNALRAIVELHRKVPGRDLTSMVPSVQKVAQSSNPALKVQAKQTLLALNTPSTAGRP
jgi:hypothetical protein